MTASSADRPRQVNVYVALLVVGAVIMALLGWSASAYYVPALCLLLQGILLWAGKGFLLFKWVILVNQISGLALILVLWLGAGLGDAKLDISGVMLLANLLSGGPLMALLAIPIMPALHKGKRLFVWFHLENAQGVTR